LPAGNIAATDIAFLAKTQAPLAIKTREESITSIESFEQFGLAGMCHHPAATKRKEALLVREVIHPPAAHYPVKPNQSVTPTVIEEMLENLSGELPGTANLDDLSNSVWFEIVDIPSNNFLLVIT
jgi:hypothetical protein